MNTITRRQFLQRSLWSSLGLFSGSLLYSCTRDRHPMPNIVFILIDDLGWQDVSYHGSRLYETPNIDRLAEEGMRFSNAYAASGVCSPTRASIMTGKYPARVRITDWIPGRGDSPDNKLLQVQDRDNLALQEVTIAERLQEAGYATCYIGKWHLGGPGYLPQDQGFDVNIAGNRRGSPPSYYYPYRRNDYQLAELAKTGDEGEYLTDRLSREAVRFISQHTDHPFFLYLSHYAVHKPIQPKSSLRDYYEKKLNRIPESEEPKYQSERYNAVTQLVQDDPGYAAMVQSTDESVGRILQALGQSGVAENTVIFFISDNGGLSTLPAGANTVTANTPLRAGKGWLYEGGIREPMIIKWPGITKAGSVCDYPVISTDFYPTILEMTGLELDPEQHKDGLSLVPLLRGKNHLQRDALYWHYPHYHGSNARPHGAIRKGPYKLLEFFEEEGIELYNLGQDIGECENLVDRLPEKAKQLQDQLSQWRKSINADMPEPNPDYSTPDE